MKRKDTSKRLYFKIYLYRKTTRFLLCCNFRYHDCTIFALFKKKALLDFKRPTTSKSIYKGIASRRWSDGEQVHFQHEVVHVSSGCVARAGSSHAGRCHYMYQSWNAMYSSISKSCRNEFKNLIIINKNLIIQVLLYFM